MLSRRRFIGSGMSAVAIGLLARRGMALGAADPCEATGAIPLDLANPILDVTTLPGSVLFDGFPFAKSWSGDWPEDLVHPPVRVLDKQPTPTESTDVVVIGGGVGGLGAAYLLRHRHPVVLDLTPRFGGMSMGEKWGDVYYSLGGAYVITPDKGSFLESLYTELGLDNVHRQSIDDETVELNAKISTDFWKGIGLPPEEAAAFQKYAEIVAYYTENYPEIPLPEGKDNAWILALDNKTLKQDIEERLGAAAPPLLAAGIQSYCYSSFNAGWEELSAAAGWNFIAAEEFGRWVFPGGNAWLVGQMWRHLAKIQRDTGKCLLRSRCRAMDVRIVKDGALVTYADERSALHTIHARKVVMACPKFVAKHIIKDLATIDLDRSIAMNAVVYRPYIVANILLDAPVQLDFYDIFLLGDGVYPTNDGEAETFSRVTDVLAGHYARRRPASARSVLTLYWPLPFGTGRFTLIPEVGPLENYAKRLAPQLRSILKLLEVPESSVRQVRLTRWGHAMPIARPGLIANGVVDVIRAPMNDTLYFVQQDNFGLPAVENTLQEAQTWAAAIDQSLG